MKKFCSIKTVPILLVLLCGISTLLGAQDPGDIRIDFNPAATHVDFTLDDVLHTVRGSFQLKSGSIHFNPATGAAGGALVVDVSSGDSGNKSRDRKMHKEILESAKYSDATFRPMRVLGHFAESGNSQLQVQGTFSLHGADHELTVSIVSQVTGSQVEIQGQFVIPYVKWGLKDPSTFILRVNKEVQMNITATGTIVGERR